MYSSLVLLSFVVAVFGVLFASQATLGVALVGCACLLGIYARIAQAYEYAQRTAQPESPEHAPAVVPEPAK